MSEAATTRIGLTRSSGSSYWCWSPVAVVGNSYYGDQPILYRVLVLLVLALLAGWFASLTQKGGDFFTLVKGSRNEIRKVVWPTRQETTANDTDCVCLCDCDGPDSVGPR